MPHWPQQQAHALVLRVTRADRRYAGVDLSVLDADLRADRVVTSADLVRDGLSFPEFYGDDILLPEGKTPAYLGQAVAILIYHDFNRFCAAKQKLRSTKLWSDMARRLEHCGATLGGIQVRAHRWRDAAER